MKQKNHTFLLDVFKEITKKKSNARLLLIGDGLLMQQIKEKSVALNIQDKVIFLGIRNDVADLYNVMDVFVLPSLYEGLPITGIEVQANSLPLLCSDNITKEIIISGNIKQYSLKSTANEWACKIIEMKRTEKISLLKINNFDIKKEAKKLEHIYMKLSNIEDEYIELNELVSIIIPVYNTEKYLDICIQSVLNQTYKNTEIILVDDGSSDLSGKKCDEYKLKDKRITVLHKINGGLSSARNEGMKIAHGEYITFVDSDDYIAHDYIEKSLELCKKYNADISILHMLYIPEYINKEIDNKKQKLVFLLNSQQAIEESLYQNNFSCCVPSKLYKKEVLKGIEFPVGKLCEDLAVCHKILDKSKLIVYSSKVGYYYRQQESSIMHIFNQNRLDALQFCNDIEEFCIQKYPKILKAVKCRIFNIAVHLLLDLPEKGEVRDFCYKKIISGIERNRLSVLTDIKSRKREKAAAFLSYFGESVLKKVWNSRFAVKQIIK